MRDIEKYNEAAIAGYLLIRITPQSVMSGAAVRYVKRALLRPERDTMQAERKLHDVRRTLKGLVNSLD